MYRNLAIANLGNIFYDLSNLMSYLEIQIRNYDNNLAYGKDIHNHLSNLEVKKGATNLINYENSHKQEIAVAE